MFSTGKLRKSKVCGETRRQQCCGTICLWAGKCKTLLTVTNNNINRYQQQHYPLPTTTLPVTSNNINRYQLVIYYYRASIEIREKYWALCAIIVPQLNDIRVLMVLPPSSCIFNRNVQINGIAPCWVNFAKWKHIHGKAN